MHAALSPLAASRRGRRLRAPDRATHSCDRMDVESVDGPRAVSAVRERRVDDADGPRRRQPGAASVARVAVRRLRADVPADNRFPNRGVEPMMTVEARGCPHPGPGCREQNTGNASVGRAAGAQLTSQTTRVGHRQTGGLYPLELSGCRDSRRQDPADGSRWRHLTGAAAAHCSLCRRVLDGDVCRDHCDTPGPCGEARCTVCYPTTDVWAERIGMRGRGDR